MRFLYFLRCMTVMLMPLGSIAATASFECGSRPITVGFYEFGLLFHDNRGVDKDVITALAERSGCSFEARVMARARTWAELKSGHLDMTVSAHETPERDAFAWFAPYLHHRNYVVLPKELANKVKSEADFFAHPNLQVGVVRSFKYGEELDVMLDHLARSNRVQEFVDVELIFRNLKARRIDAALALPLVYRKYLSEFNMRADVVIEDWAPHDEIGIIDGLALSKRRFSEREADQWRALLREMRDDGTLAKIYRRYLSPNEASDLLRF